MDKEKYRNIITLFLQLNPTPADAQVHALAAALGVDKEELESVFYEMLAEKEKVVGFRVEAATRLGILTLAEAGDSQEVLDSPTLDPDNMSLDDVSMNDGDPTDDDLGMKAETDDDGTDEQDVGLGLTNDDILTDDGAPDLQIGG